MIERKQDASRIRDHLAALRKQYPPTRNWWPTFLFHFTDIQNAVGILTDGKLLARSKGAITTDIASKQVIDHTDSEWKDYVRFYLRPRTPTQYKNEGFRPEDQHG